MAGNYSETSEFPSFCLLSLLRFQNHHIPLNQPAHVKKAVLGVIDIFIVLSKKKKKNPLGFFFLLSPG